MSNSVMNNVAPDAYCVHKDTGFPNAYRNYYWKRDPTRDNKTINNALHVPILWYGIKHFRDGELVHDAFKLGNPKETYVDPRYKATELAYEEWVKHE